jgi:hypothetical protein
MAAIAATRRTAGPGTRGSEHAVSPVAWRRAPRASNAARRGALARHRSQSRDRAQHGLWARRGPQTGGRDRRRRRSARLRAIAGGEGRLSVPGRPIGRGAFSIHGSRRGGDHDVTTWSPVRDEALKNRLFREDADGSRNGDAVVVEEGALVFHIETSAGHAIWSYARCSSAERPAGGGACLKRLGNVRGRGTGEVQMAGCRAIWRCAS